VFRHSGRPPARFRARRTASLAVPAAALGGLLAAAPGAAAQTDFYNTDHGRPLQVEDAAPVERHAFELQAAPVRLERGPGGAYEWGVEPSLAWGVLPRTQVELGVPIAWRDRARGAGSRAGVAGVELSALHQLNTETTTLPALAVSASALAPVGALGPAHPYASATAIATRTLSWGRVHANAQATVGPTPRAGAAAAPRTAAPGAPEQARWMAGLAVDHTFAVRSLLVAGEAVARRPLAGDGIEWTVGAGTRWQAAPRWALDAGAGRRVTGDEAGWYLTVGSAYAFGLPRAFGGR
jgi:hypothetical protein